MKNFFTITLGALGVPMLLMGDEVRRTQFGNNNAYCQDNEISWFDWTLLDKRQDIYRFVRRLIHMRLNLDIFVAEHGLSLIELLEIAQIQWHGTKLHKPDWGHNSHSLAFTVRSRSLSFHLMLNAYWKPLKFQLPALDSARNGRWQRIIDTHLESPDDFNEITQAPVVGAESYTLQPHSIVVLAAENRR